MKFTAIYTLFSLAIAVAAFPLEFETRETDISFQSRAADEQNYLQERSDDYEDSVLERDYASDENYLGVRYLDPTYQLSEREYAEIEKRIGAASIAKVAIKGIEAIVNLIKGIIEKDKDMRGKWTSALVGRLRNKHPHYNWMVCHTQHKYNFKGVRGKDWGHSHHELNVHFSKTVGFEIYWFKAGTFDRIGDGGYLNWAYLGNVISQSKDKKHTVFAAPR